MYVHLVVGDATSRPPLSHLQFEMTPQLGLLMFVISLIPLDIRQWKKGPYERVEETRKRGLRSQPLFSSRSLPSPSGSGDETLDPICRFTP